MEIRKVTAQDEPVLLELLKGLPSAEVEQFLPYARPGLLKQVGERNEGYGVFAGSEDARCLGGLLFSVVADICEVELVITAVDCRRTGVASKLLNALLKGLEAGVHESDARVTRLQLEVRRANTAALSFYKRNDFEVSGTRKNYYQRPVDDAILMHREL